MRTSTLIGWAAAGLMALSMGLWLWQFRDMISALLKGFTQ